MAETTIRKVPIKTPMFDEDFVDGTLLKHLNRTWIIFFEQLLEAISSATKETTGEAGAVGPWIRTLLLKDTTIGDDIADHVPVFIAGTTVRLIGVLRKVITTNLTVRCKLDGTTLVTLTIPSSTAIDTPVMETTFTPPDLPDLGILTWDVTASEGLQDANGVASFTLQWGPTS